jgi:hypothetical protein
MAGASDAAPSKKSFTGVQSPRPLKAFCSNELRKAFSSAHYWNQGRCHAGARSEENSRILVARPPRSRNPFRHLAPARSSRPLPPSHPLSVHKPPRKRIRPPTGPTGSPGRAEDLVRRSPRALVEIAAGCAPRSAPGCPPASAEDHPFAPQSASATANHPPAIRGRRGLR